MTEPNEIAKKLLDILPPSMNWIRNEMRASMREELSVPQYRILANIYHGKNVACDIAKHQGVSQAAMSKMIDSLVDRGLVERVPNVNDRRHFHLNLTFDGDAFFKKTRKKTQSHLKEQISKLTDSEKEDLENGLKSLEKLFISARSKDN